jgi:septal ring factor EnvC (AmiA/AmiB activator)
MFRTLNFDGDTIMQNDDQITQLQDQLDAVNKSLNNAHRTLRSIRSNIQKIDAVVDVEEKIKALRQYLLHGLSQVGRRKTKPVFAR